MKSISVKIGWKISLIVNFGLILVMAVGTYLIMTRQDSALEEQLVERGRVESMVGAGMVGYVLESLIDRGTFSVEDIFDQQYIQIPGYDPPKFHTKYDTYLDKILPPLQDEFLNDRSIVFAVGVDINGYLPTHNSRFNQAMTGDRETDLKINRTKRIFNDRTGIKASRNTQKGFLQVYKRDTGEVFYDFSSPIYVKGKQWGAFRVGFALDKIRAAKQDQLNSLLVLMAAISIFSIVFMIVVINIMLRPLGALTETVSELAGGRTPESSAVTAVGGELGKLAGEIEKLRVKLGTSAENSEQHKPL